MTRLFTFYFRLLVYYAGKTNTIHDYATIFIMQIKRRLIYNINQQYARISKMINKHNFFCSGKVRLYKIPTLISPWLFSLVNGV